MFVPQYDYLTLIAYFQERPRNVEMVANECRGLLHEVLGDREVWRSDGARNRRIALHLGDPWRVEPDCRSFFAQASAETVEEHDGPRLEKDLVTIDLHEHAGQDGPDAPPCLRVGVSLEGRAPRYVPPVKEMYAAIKALRPFVRLVKEFGELVSKTGVFAFGHGDICDISQTMMGWHFGEASNRVCDFQRQLRRWLWIRTGADRVRKVRGVYWANLFGPEMMERLGGQQFIVEYGRLRATAGELCTKYADGTVLALITEKVEPMMYPQSSLDEAILNRAAWLYERLAGCGLMPGWPSPRAQQVRHEKGRT